MVTKHIKMVLVLLVHERVHIYTNSNLSCIKVTDLKKHHISHVGKSDEK